jgi:hypothetical protein
MDINEKHMHLKRINNNKKKKTHYIHPYIADNVQNSQLIF